MTIGRLLRFPLASASGCALALLASSVCVLAAPTCGASTMAPFAGCAIPAIAGLWIDWARLYPATRRTKLASGAALATALVFSAASAALGVMELAPVTFLTTAIAIVAGVRALWWLAARGRSEWAVMSGHVRREERDRVVLDAGGDVIELGRDAGDLGGRRTIAITAGCPLAVLARFDAEVAPDPYRSEPRLRATHVVAAAPDVASVRRRLFARARSWALYACALALLAAFVGDALTPPPPPSCRLPDVAAP